MVCLKCMGRKMLCGLPRCPILDRVRSYRLSLRLASDMDLFGSLPPSAIVGEAGWPRVNVYLGQPPEVFGEEARSFDDPTLMWGLPLEEIARRRSYMAFGFVRAERPSALGELALAAVSSRPVDAELILARRPRPSLRLDLRERPVGPTAPLQRVLYLENPSVPSPVERAAHDDMEAGETAVQLYRAGVDIYTIQRAFALGLLGRRARRRLVPSRWSITAVDVAVGDWLAQAVRPLPDVSEPLYGYGEYLDNSYLVLLRPGPLRFAYLERWIQGDRVVEVSVREGLRGRRSTMDGGFEAARLAVLEKLYSMGRRASVALVRRIGEGYYLSVGNWQIRETIRRIQLRRIDEGYLEAVKRVGADPARLLGGLEGYLM